VDPAIGVNRDETLEVGGTAEHLFDPFNDIALVEPVRRDRSRDRGQARKRSHEAS
jgi:hypothetical protein